MIFARHGDLILPFDSVTTARRGILRTDVTASNGIYKSILKETRLSSGI